MLCGFFLPSGSQLSLGVFPGRFEFWIFWRRQSCPGRPMIKMHIYAAIDERARYALYVLKSCIRRLFFCNASASLRDERQKIDCLIFSPIAWPQSRAPGGEIQICERK
jgi:hypothetical protein